MSIKKILFFIFFSICLLNLFKMLFNAFLKSKVYDKLKISFNLYYDRFKRFKIYPKLHKLVIKIRRFFIRKNDVLEIYFGLPGSGKTTVAASLARKYNKAEIPVYSNEPLTNCFQYDPKTDIGVYDISDALVIVDEAGAYFSGRNFKTNFTNEAMAWWVRHRHAGCKCVILSQDFEQCDITFRRLAYRYYYCKKSIIPGFIKCVPLRRKLDIDEITHKPTDYYSFPFLLLRPFVSKYVYGPLVWRYFDSWSMPPLKKKIFKKW